MFCVVSCLCYDFLLVCALCCLVCGFGFWTLLTSGRAARAGGQVVGASRWWAPGRAVGLRARGRALGVGASRLLAGASWLKG
jgi:hypothetical protein